VKYSVSFPGLCSKISSISNGIRMGIGKKSSVEIAPKTLARPKSFFWVRRESQRERKVIFAFKLLLFIGILPKS